MENIKIDAMGQRCPEPVLKVAVVASKMAQGGVIEIVSDCETFEQDIRVWVKRMRKSILEVSQSGKAKTIKIKI